MQRGELYLPYDPEITADRLRCQLALGPAAARPRRRQSVPGRARDRGQLSPGPSLGRGSGTSAGTPVPALLRLL